MDPSLQQEPLTNHSTVENLDTETHTPDKNTTSTAETERSTDSPLPTSRTSTPDLQDTLEANSYHYCAYSDTDSAAPLEYPSDDLQIELRERDRIKLAESLLSKNSDPLPQTSEEDKLIKGEQTDEVIFPSDNVFYSELRNKNIPSSAPHSPSVAFPSKRKTERKSLFGPPSLPQMYQGRSSVFYAPLGDEFGFTSESGAPHSAKSPPSKRHSSLLASKNQYPILFELSCGDSDAGQNLSVVERIEREYKIKEGTVKLFNAAKNLQQSMDAAKSFFTSNAKIIALLRQLQSRKVEEREQLDEDRTDPFSPSNDPFAPCNDPFGPSVDPFAPSVDPSLLSVELPPESSRATISLSHIRIPLEWREFDGLKKPIDTGWVFCLFKLDGQVADTQTLLQIDRNTNDINFPDVIIFPVPVTHEFRLEIEVYFSQGLFSGKDGGGISKGLKGLKSKWSTDSISSGQSGSYDSPSNMPRYHLAGFASLSLGDVSEGLYTYKLNKGAVGSSPSAATHTSSKQLLPLWGQICCQIYVVPTGAKGSRLEGFVDLHTMIKESPVWQHYWCVLKQTTFFFWNSPDDARGPHICSLELAGHMEVRRPRAEDGSFRKNSFIIFDSDTTQHAISFASKEERVAWSREVSRCIRDMLVWQNYATKCQIVPELLTSKKSFNNRTKRVASPIESLRQSIIGPPDSCREGHAKRCLSTNTLL